jgi:predicted GTPase
MARNGGLAAATAEAVAASRQVWERLADGVSAVTGELMAALPPVGLTTAVGTAAGFPAPGSTARHGDQVRDLLAKERDLVGAVASELRGLVSRQGTAIGTFNLVLFGRTGAGKSSLIEALTGGTGASISHGESDWTTDVAITSWVSCRLYDTPGIAGWGRTVSREELQERARQAVAAADVVLLCFDSQSQQAEEFRLTAEWIAAYGKPVIAVLNNRNKMWRDPLRVRDPQQRLQLSQTVAEHASTIRDELERIGLRNVPIIALNTMRAVYARASDPYHGPPGQYKTMQRQRQRAGQARLLDWSNLPALELLLVTAISSDAVRLRLGGLIRQVEASLALAGAELTRELRDPALLVATEVERGLEHVLDLLGLETAAGGEPGESQQSQAVADAAYRQFRADIARLERLRGGRFQVSATGQAALHAGHLIGAGFGPLRADAQRRSDTLIGEAMAARRDVQGAEFARRVYDQAALGAAAERVAGEFVAYLNQQTGLAIQDTAADISWVTARQAEVSGRAGRGLRLFGRFGGIGSRLAGIGLTGVLTAAALNAYNPVGWMLGAAALAGAAVGIIGRLLSRKAALRAEQEHEAALGRSRANARMAVNSTFDAIASELRSQLMALLRRELAGHAAEAVATALLLREIAVRADAGDGAAARFRLTLADAGDPAEVLRDARAACEAATELGPRGPAALWLGESWCEDQEGGPADGATAELWAERFRPAPAYASRLRLDLRAALAGALAAPTRGAGQEWLALARRRLADDALAAPALRELDVLATPGRPRVVVCGDYDTGKSSFIRRLLTDAGQPAPSDLAVSARPQTSAAAEYDWKGYTLVDVPGFQSGHAEHAIAARAEIRDAALLIWLLGPNLVVGDAADLQSVLAGDADHGVPGKLGRTLFVVHRSDAFGPDPMDDPEAFTRLAERKEAELADALGALPALRRLGARAERAAMVCMASAPYELVPAGPADGRWHRSWDGFTQFERELAGVHFALASNAADVSVLDGGRARIGALAAEAQADLVVLRDRSVQLGQLSADAAGQLAVGELIAQDRTAALRSGIDDFLNGLLSKAWSTRDESMRTAIASRLADWRADPEFRQFLAEWLATTNEQLGDWQRNTKTRLGARAGSQQFRAAFAGVTGPAAGPSPSVARALRHADRAIDAALAAAAAHAVGHALSYVDPASVFDWGLHFGHVLSVVDALQIASDISDLAATLTGIGFLIDVYRLTRMLRHQWVRDTQQRDMVDGLRTDGQALADDVIEQTLDSERDACAALRELIGQLDADLAELADAQAAVGARLSAYQEVIAAAQARAATGRVLARAT